MPVGLEIFNNSSEMVVSSDAKLMHYMSKAVFQSITQISGRDLSIPPNQLPNPGVQAGYSTYLITIPVGSPFILGMDLPIGTAEGTRCVGITGLTYLGSDIWEIRAYNADPVSETGDGFDNTQHVLDIWSFGWQPVLAENFGLALYDKTGNLSADFSRPKPLFPRFISDFRYTKTQTIPEMSRPVVIGMPSYYRADGFEQETGYQNTYIKQMGFWNRSTVTTLNQVTRKLQQFGYGEEFPTDDQGYIDHQSMVILIEGALLP